MRPLPPLTEASTGEGTLVVTWAAADVPPEVTRAAVLVALRPLTPDLAEAFWSGALEADLIRYPVEAREGRARLHVPAGREVTLAFVVRGEGDAPRPGPRLTVEGPPPQRLATPSARPTMLEGPVGHAHREPTSGADIPLVFAGPGTPPDFEALARRVAQTAAGRAQSPATDDPTPSGGFGTHQRWYLTRLAWTPPEGAELACVLRPTFIGPDELAAWRDAPPPDATSLPPGTDALVDGLSPEGRATFYAVLAGPAPWRPLALSPLAPPFTSAERPALLGPVEARLAEATHARLEAIDHQPLVLTDLPPQLALLEAAVAVLDSGSELRQVVEAAVTRHRSAPHL